MWKYGVIVIVIVILGGFAWYMLRPEAGNGLQSTAALSAATTSQYAGKLDASDKVYVNEKLNFSLAYPSDLDYQEFDEGGGSFTILFKNTDATKTFQIFVTPHVGWFVSPERIAMDIPSRKVESPIEVTVNGAKGTIFFSEHPSLGATREAWFLHGDYLYEVTTYRDLDEWLSYIMSTWKFIRAAEHTQIP